MDTECTGRRMKNREFLTKELAPGKRNEISKRGKLNGNLQNKMLMKSYLRIM